MYRIIYKNENGRFVSRIYRYLFLARWEGRHLIRKYGVKEVTIRREV